MPNQPPQDLPHEDKNTQNTPLKNVVYLDRDALPKHVDLKPREDQYQWLCYPFTRPEDVIKRSQYADVLVINKVIIDRDILLACPRIKHIAVSATGYNVVDLNACQELGVSVSNTPSYALRTVPEHVMMMSLCLRRQMLNYRQQVLAGDWSRSGSFCLFDTPIHDCHQAVFGVLGFGELGQATAQLAHAFGMRVIYCSRTQKTVNYASAVSFEQLLTQSDILSIHSSLTPETANIIGTAQLRLMKDSAILINTARGGIVDEQAACEAIRNGQISALGFDVLTQEPPVNGNPLLEIADLPNVMISPHNAWASHHATQTLGNTLMANIHGFLDGLPQNIVSN